MRIRMIRTTRRARQNEETLRLPLRRGCDRHEPISEGGLACGIQGGPGRWEKIGRETKEKKEKKVCTLNCGSKNCGKRFCGGIMSRGRSRSDDNDDYYDDVGDEDEDDTTTMTVTMRIGRRCEEEEGNDDDDDDVSPE